VLTSYVSCTDFRYWIYYEKVVQMIFAFDVYAKYSIEKNYILGYFSQIHLILYVKFQWSCHLALIPKVAHTNIGVGHKSRYYNWLGCKCLEAMAKWIVSPYSYYCVLHTNLVFSVTHFYVWRLWCIHIIQYLRCIVIIIQGRQQKIIPQILSLIMPTMAVRTENNW
jgi:hypothetical protein